MIIDTKQIEYNSSHILNERLDKIEDLWKRQRLVGVHKDDVRLILIDLYDALEAQQYPPVHLCPVCFNFGLEHPPEDFEICPSCGTEFGCDDFEKSHLDLRKEWIAGGCRWWSKNVNS